MSEVRLRKYDLHFLGIRFDFRQDCRENITNNFESAAGDERLMSHSTSECGENIADIHNVFDVSTVSGTSHGWS